MRVLNKRAFKMDQIYRFKLDNYIQYYDYDLCEENSEDEYSDEEPSPNNRHNNSQHLGQRQPIVDCGGSNNCTVEVPTYQTENPFTGGDMGNGGYSA